MADAKARDIVRLARRWGFVERTGGKHRTFSHPLLPDVRFHLNHGARQYSQSKIKQYTTLLRAIARLREMGYEEGQG